MKKRQFQFERLEARRGFALSIGAIPVIAVSEGAAATLMTTFHDASTQTVYTAEVDWGDGTKADPQVTPPRRGTGSLTVRVDYRFDTLGFFNAAAKRDIMNAAAQSVADRFADQLGGLTSSGADRFFPIINNPATGARVIKVTNGAIISTAAPIFSPGAAHFTSRVRQSNGRYPLAC